MAEFKLDAKMIGLLTFIGSIIMIIAVFLTWYDAEITLIGQSSTTSYSGMDLIGDKFENIDGWQKYVPVIGLVFGIIMILIEIIDYFKPEVLAKYSAIIVFLLSLIFIILGALYTTWDQFDSADAIVASAKTSVGYGCWVGIIGAVIALIFSIGQAIPAFKALAKKD